MIMMEDSLREMFTAKVEAPPVADDPAGTVIQRGRSARRRRTVGSSFAVAAALVLVIAGMTTLGGGWLPDRSGPSSSVAGFSVDSVDPYSTAPVDPPVEPSLAARNTGIGLDIRSGDQLWTTEGRRLSLTGVGEVTRVYRVPAGWVYAGAGKVRLLRPDGSARSLSGEDDRWVLSADGNLFAFQIGTTLYYAKITTSGMAVVGDVPVPADSWPVALTAERVVISNGPHGYGFVNLTQPAAPLRNANVTAVYAPAGADLVGLVREKNGSRTCLARLAPDGGQLLPVRVDGCALGLSGTAADGGLAPDGRWLAERRTADVALIDVERTLGGGSDLVSCPVTAAVTPVWADDRTVVTGDEGRVVRCRTDGTKDEVPLPDGVQESWQPVPRLIVPVDGR
ncbi:hypothetical protein [Plantactinospora soyae]|uniref:Uncharacterized protein n=1 Tax=Plantactinospora soyae TaxID=1544732 RepID=A0A927M2G3_9ACTN|nr:hypothetical protein [Plantactinospora soyae]MBE1486862.1 hypothetical protein [Plantactinospora soyae]